MRRAVPVAAALLLALLAGGCNDGGDIDVGDVRIEPVQAGDEYVALGDSYTSAPGVGVRTGPRSCLQTDLNYPHLLAEQLDLELTDVSCGGAKTTDLTGSQDPVAGRPVPPQLDAVSPKTDLVTLSIGGNDSGVFGNLVTTCVRLARENPDGAPCQELSQVSNGRTAEVLDAIEERIVDVLGEIRERAPEARIVVVGYPQIFPASGTCDRLPLAEGDVPFAHEIIRQLTLAMKEAADRTRAEYVDVWSATDGHDICAVEPWVAGAKPERPATPYHPYAEEQRAVADLLVEKVS
ncbi:SGNH/GDSL hydrolase family protein [Nocardioides sp. SYSU DS0651]|uniref:SGNH/GDSL hydrolase family protein n=1 Tax=Nocardioides sp. SYSU DS0651 TaxID=3415955 RepID=UPI003F4C8E34